MKVQELNQLVQKSSDKLSILTDEKIWSELTGTGQEFRKLIEENLNVDEIAKCLEFLSSISENEVAEYTLKNLNAENLTVILSNHKQFVESITDEYNIANLISKVNDSTKLDLVSEYNLEGYKAREVYKSLSDENKTAILINGEIDLDNYEKEDLMASFSSEGFTTFVKEQKDYMRENELTVYNSIKQMEAKKQLEIIDKLNQMELTEDEVKKCFVVLKNEAKKVLKQREDISDDMKDILDINYPIEINFEEDSFEKYNGLDELIGIAPDIMPLEYKEKIKELCKICPDINIKNLTIGYCTTQEYLRSEEWINEVLSGIEENWSDIQKVAFVDHAIGTKISYCPDFNTEVFDKSDARSIWRIIDSGYGVCNGIANVEQYMLKHLGIATELISSGKHSFLKLVDIELPQADGTTIRENTILDPTWNLATHQYGMYPANFCKSYEEIRKHDVDSDGVDHLCHKNDEELSDATYEMEEQVLREVFKSIGLTREDGKFLCTDFFDKSDEIGKMQLNEKEAIERQLTILQEYNPNFAKAQNSNALILKKILDKKSNIPFKRCEINRVYEKNDEAKKPVQYLYLDMPRDGRLFYYVDKDKSEFVNISQKDFEERFECYEMDLQATNGIRPWQTEQNIEVKEDLNQSSGKVAASEEKGEL